MLLKLKYLTLLCALKMDSNCVLGKNSVIEPKIIKGTVAKAEESKYQVSIRLKERDWFFGSGHICGGSLINPSMVLTAAHCIYNIDLIDFRTANEFTVSMGSMDKYDRTNSTTFEVLDIYYMETFNISTYVDDIAIIILNGYVPENYNNIKPIEINWDIIPDDTICQVSGWGVTEDGGTSDLLMTLDVPIVNKAFCAKNYDGYLLEGMICAGYINGSADACDGDSGGPLVCNGRLTAIVSFGVGCAVKNYPGVYTNLTYYSEWIKNLTNRYETPKSSAVSRVSECVFLVLLLVTVTVREFYFQEKLNIISFCI